MGIKKNEWLKWGIVIIVLIIVILVTISSQSETGPIKVGFISALSGEAAAYGEVEKNATRMAIDEINASGGINGRQIEVIYEDGKCGAKDALTAVNKLIFVDKVKVILGAGCSSETLAIIPLIHKNKILAFSAASSHPDLTGASKYFFRNFPSDLANANVDATIMSKLYKKVAIVTENGDYPVGIEKIMKSIFLEKKVEVSFIEHFTSDVRDFKTIMTKIKSSGAQAVYFNPTPSSVTAGIMIKQARDIGLSIPIHANPTFTAVETIKNAGEYIDGVITSENSALSEKGQNLIKKYSELFNKEPINMLLASNYDRAYIIAQAIKAVGYDSDKIADYLRNLKEYDGAIGKYHFDQNGDVVGVGFIPVIIESGKTSPYLLVD